MAIYDNNGTTSYEIAKLWDNDGTTSYQIGKIWDNDGTTNSLIYQSYDMNFYNKGYQSPDVTWKTYVNHSECSVAWNTSNCQLNSYQRTKYVRWATVYALVDFTNINTLKFNGTSGSSASWTADVWYSYVGVADTPTSDPASISWLKSSSSHSNESSWSVTFDVSNITGSHYIIYSNRFGAQEGAGNGITRTTYMYSFIGSE